MSEVIVDFPQKQKGGESQMVNFDTWMMVKALGRQGWSKSKIAKHLDITRKTVRKILKQVQPELYQRNVSKPSILLPYKDFILRRVKEVDYHARKIYEEIKQKGYEGSYDTVKVFIRPFREERDRLEEATVRFETAPGQQAQVDWGSTKVMINGEFVRVHLFVMVLGYSRRLYLEFTKDETLNSFIPCHEHAFDWFGGITEEILYDNPKTVVLKRDWEGKSIQWNPKFWDFANYYGFRPNLCQIYRARTKGKVESGIKYVKNSFVKGSNFFSFEHLNESGLNWALTVADQRVHGTTYQKPADLFSQEKEYLINHMGKPPYQIQQRIFRKVAPDCMVMVGTNRYSVPYRYVGKTVEIQLDNSTFKVYHKGEEIATHLLRQEKHRAFIDPKHYEGLFKLGRDSHAKEISSHCSLWSVADEAVEIRDLSTYEALI